MSKRPWFDKTEIEVGVLLFIALLMVLLPLAILFEMIFGK